jgi:peptidoglycan/xylan/chitin deacetylase (PgdA/CDA1 family)
MKAAIAGAGMLGAAALPAMTFLTPVRALLPRLRGIGAGNHVALTFDDGPDQRSTPHFLNLLRQRGIHATFFMVGEQLTRNVSLGKEIAAAGHEVAVHGWSHRNVLVRNPKAIYDDLAATYDLVADVTGTQPRWYRPPYGVLSWPALSAVQRLGLTPVLWTSWGWDWSARATSASVSRTVIRDLRGGATILLHDSDRYAALGSWRATLGAVPSLLNECEHRELTVGPLREHGLDSIR